ncbi:hypothetical protein [Streptomyces aurantiacus]|uniref:hypothetical protein n=1 Tax=Streptomyces aurantiacus TaxID=47760 RepID=UPI0027D7B05B|nr:hypothetical protein [Streptomyces aurantiacus]
MLRAHLNFAETAGGRLHGASERQTAEEAGVSRQTLRNAYATVLKPGGWLRRLRAGQGREGSTWYLDNGPDAEALPPLSRQQTTQFPPDPALEEWSTSKTSTSADIDSTVISHLMAHDAFAHHGLGSSALMIIGALHVRSHQTASELVITSSVSRATTYRTLHRLKSHGLVHHIGEVWSLAPRALEGFGNSFSEAVTDRQVLLAHGWDLIAAQYGTTGTAAHRRALHSADRAMYRQALEHVSEHRSRALVVVRDGRPTVVPAVRPDEVPPLLRGPGGAVLDPATGRDDPAWRVASDGRLILITPYDQRSYEELAAAYSEALSEWESVA